MSWNNDPTQPNHQHFWNPQDAERNGDEFECRIEKKQQNVERIHLVSHQLNQIHENDAMLLTLEHEAAVRSTDHKNETA